jgi:hypothetical protein
MTEPRNAHVVILPYYCESEIARYTAIAGCLREFPGGEVDYEFLLAASPKIEISQSLHAVFSRIAPTTSFRCPTQVFGYPQGPTAMFWDCMDYVANEMNRRPGFSLWLESDMTIVKPDWMDRLDAEWTRANGEGEKLIMGNVVPDVYRRRLFRSPKKLLPAHVNGGACYHKDFARRMPAESRQGVFDMAVYHFARAVGGIHPTDQICFSTLQRVWRDVADPSKVVLHGFMQDKDRFVERCLAAVAHGRTSSTLFDPMARQLENLGRQVRIYFVKRGPQAMLENVLLAQDRTRGRRAA